MFRSFPFSLVNFCLLLKIFLFWFRTPAAKINSAKITQLVSLVSQSKDIDARALLDSRENIAKKVSFRFQHNCRSDIHAITTLLPVGWLTERLIVKRVSRLVWRLYCTPSSFCKGGRERGGQVSYISFHTFYLNVSLRRKAKCLIIRRGCESTLELAFNSSERSKWRNTRKYKRYKYEDREKWMVFAEAVCIVGGNRETEKRFLRTPFVFFLVICLISCLFRSPFLDIDECKTNSHDCNANAYCYNTEGSYHCFCKPGYIRNGRSCASKFDTSWGIWVLICKA